MCLSVRHFSQFLRKKFALVRVDTFSLKEINILNSRFRVAVMFSDVTFVLFMYV